MYLEFYHLNFPMDKVQLLKKRILGLNDRNSSLLEIVLEVVSQFFNVTKTYQLMDNIYAIAVLLLIISP